MTKPTGPHAAPHPQHGGRRLRQPA